MTYEQALVIHTLGVFLMGSLITAALFVFLRERHGLALGIITSVMTGTVLVVAFFKVGLGGTP